jgi:hypothetical protein
MNIYTAVCVYDLHGAEPEEYDNFHTKLVGLGFDNELMYNEEKRRVKMTRTTVVGEFYEDSSEKLESFLEDQIMKFCDILDIKANFFLMLARECRWTAREANLDES